MMREWVTALLLSAMVLSGCMGKDPGGPENAAKWEESFTQLSLEGLDDIRNFSVGYAFDNNSIGESNWACLLYTSPSPRDATLSRMPSSA